MEALFAYYALILYNVWVIVCVFMCVCVCVCVCVGFVMCGYFGNMYTMP